MKKVDYQFPMLMSLWKRYEDCWDWLVDMGQTKIGGYILAFSFFIGSGLMIGFIISEFIRAYKIGGF